ncbi:unnamed protein product [Amoebophrya sp. A25]|nr:unnamed protein product [Amoebophrya sp. A25]|eukprot:GSA25T00002499001.1
MEVLTELFKMRLLAIYFATNSSVLAAVWRGSATDPSHRLPAPAQQQMRMAESGPQGKLLPFEDLAVYQMLKYQADYSGGPEIHAECPICQQENALARAVQGKNNRTATGASAFFGREEEEKKIWRHFCGHAVCASCKSNLTRRKADDKGCVLCRQGGKMSELLPMHLEEKMGAAGGGVATAEEFFPRWTAQDAVSVERDVDDRFFFTSSSGPLTTPASRMRLWASLETRVNEEKEAWLNHVKRVVDIREQPQPLRIGAKTAAAERTQPLWQLVRDNSLLYLRQRAMLQLVETHGAKAAIEFVASVLLTPPPAPPAAESGGQQAEDARTGADHDQGHERRRSLLRQCCDDVFGPLRAGVRGTYADFQEGCDFHGPLWCPYTLCCPCVAVGRCSWHANKEAARRHPFAHSTVLPILMDLCLLSQCGASWGVCPHPIFPHSLDGWMHSIFSAFGCCVRHGCCGTAHDEAARRPGEQLRSAYVQQVQEQYRTQVMQEGMDVSEAWTSNFDPCCCDPMCYRPYCYECCVPYANCARVVGIYGSAARGGAEEQQAPLLLDADAASVTALAERLRRALLVTRDFSSLKRFVRQEVREGDAQIFIRDDITAENLVEDLKLALLWFVDKDVVAEGNAFV